MKDNTTISNELQIINSNNMQRFATMDMNDEENKIKLYNSLQKCDVKINDIKGQVIEFVDAYIETRDVTETDEKTGEVKQNRKFRSILYGVDGTTYVSSAYGVYNSLNTIFALFGYPTKENPCKVKIGNKPTKTAGRESLILTIVK